MFADLFYTFIFTLYSHIELSGTKEPIHTTAATTGQQGKSNHDSQDHGDECLSDTQLATLHL